ncbi:hypothetical protein KI809_18865 [Geobacter pelophilus]|uniref:TFIIB-type domain-containing protein n=1 Tax=Geoanaerobacter pelophilus TaxID=60036 RepID=A0AAW4L6F7_9BACT|nr:hypothetical protein [Geoanaerobacter pelophilus]MBT0666374.1 hypothetical protein [Geoanaerobacter pelophilus]
MECPTCKGTKIEDDCTVPGLIHKVCAQCGETLATIGGVKTLADAVRDQNRLYGIKEAA